jgi:hypothetical protein
MDNQAMLEELSHIKNNEYEQ